MLKTPKQLNLFHLTLQKLVEKISNWKECRWFGLFGK